MCIQPFNKNNICPDETSGIYMVPIPMQQCLTSLLSFAKRPRYTNVVSKGVEQGINTIEISPLIFVISATFITLLRSQPGHFNV